MSSLPQRNVLGLDAFQHCRNSKQTYMALWLWRLISVTHSSLASLAHFCNVCRWCRILCQHYLSTSSLLTQLPLWAIVENVKHWTISQLFHQCMGCHSSGPKEHAYINSHHCIKLSLTQSLNCVHQDHQKKSPRPPKETQENSKPSFLYIQQHTQMLSFSLMHLCLRAWAVVWHPLDFFFFFINPWMSILGLKMLALEE